MDRWQDKLGQKAYVLCFTKFKNRQESLKIELDRIGIEAEPIWGFPTPFPSFIIDRAGLPHTSDLDNPSYAGNWFTHYRIVKTGYESGYDRILVMEDDCRFLSDIARIETYMKDFPSESDMVMLDVEWDDRAAYESLCRNFPNGNWVKSDGNISLRSAACFSMNRRAMEAYIYLFESILDESIPERKMRNVDHWWNSTLTSHGANEIAFPKVNLAIQKTGGSLEHGFYENFLLSNYSIMGIKSEDYGG